MCPEEIFFVEAVNFSREFLIIKCKYKFKDVSNLVVKDIS